MKTSDFTEAESTIARETGVFKVALDGGPEPGGGPEPMYAAQVGVIISLFALVEGYVPQVLERLTDLSARDALSIIGTIRAFSTRIELLRAVYAPRGLKSVDHIVGSYFANLFSQANKIRNRYAHATYSTTRKSIVLKTFSGDYNKQPEHLDLKLDHFKADADKLRRIICEMHALIYRNEISLELQKRLPKPDP